jgi:hypothetical protein
VSIALARSAYTTVETNDPTSEPLKPEGDKKRHGSALDDDLGLHKKDDVQAEFGP